MNCQSFENSVVDIVRGNPIDASVLERSLAHAESCRTCGRQLEEQRMLSSQLRSFSDEMKLVNPPARIEEQLLVALRSQNFQRSRVASASRKWLGVAAIAAILLIVLGVVSLRIRQTPVKQQPLQVNIPKPGASTVSTPQVAVTLPPVATSEPQRAVRKPASVRRRPRAVDVSSLITANAVVNAPEVTTRFMPLGDVSLANLQDGAQVIRVEMPRYAMARFGVPVNMERYDETVKADVWLGVDGLARAIRFVQ